MDTETQQQEIDNLEPEAKPAKKLKNIKDEHGDVFDGNTEVRWLFDPSDLVIVGLDDLTGDKALEDDGASSKLDEAQVKNVGRFGVIEDVVIVAKDVGGTLRPVVVDGRHRTRWARAANKLKLKPENGDSKVLVHCICVPADSDEASLRGTKHMLNYVRAARDTMAAAKAAKELQEASVKTADIAVRLGVSVGTVENWLALANNATKPLIDSFQKGIVPVSAVYKLAKMKPEKQEEAVKELVSAAKASPKGRATVSKAQAAKRKSKGDDDAQPRPGIGKVRKILAAAKADAKISQALTQCEPIDFLRWLLGDVSERVLPAEIRDILKGRKKKADSEE
jgi:hypothetical protein